MTADEDAEELDAASISRLFYLNVKPEQYSHLFQALVDCSSGINLVHENVICTLKIPVTSCIGSKGSLANRKTPLSCNSSVVLSYSIAGVFRQDTFFVSCISGQPMILAMP